MSSGGGSRPSRTYRVESDGLYLAGSQPQAYVAADGWFLIITGLVGAIAGLVVWLRCRQTGLGGVVGLFLGGLGGAAVAAAVGLLLGREDPFAAPIGTITEGALEIRAWGVVLAEAGLAVIGLAAARPARPARRPPPRCRAGPGPDDDRAPEATRPSRRRPS